MTNFAFEKIVKDLPRVSVVGILLTMGLLLTCFPLAAQDQIEDLERRCVALDGQTNFRDLGGYESADGRTVKWGVLFRSGRLNALSDADLEIVGDLGIQTVVSFLTSEETEATGGDRLPVGVRETPLPIEHGVANELTQAANVARQTGDFSAVPAELNSEIHRILIEDAADVYASLIREIIAAESLPLAFHCSHGVHRTGTASAIILSLIGVPWETVREDYLLSNVTRAEEVEMRLGQLRELAAKNQGVEPDEIDTTNMEAFYILDGAYVDASLATINEEYGSVENYAKERLGLTSEEVEKLRDALLE